MPRRGSESSRSRHPSAVACRGARHLLGILGHAHRAAEPVEGLRHLIHLVVVLPTRKNRALLDEGLHPRASFAHSRLAGGEHHELGALQIQIRDLQRSHGAITMVGPGKLSRYRRQHSRVHRGAYRAQPGDRVPFAFHYSGSRRAFLRLRLRAKACLTRSFCPGFK